MSFNIEQFLLKEKIEYRTNGKNVGKGEYGITCPFCGDNHFHCCINPIKQVFHCWVCSEAGDFIKLISKIKNVSVLEVKQLINPYNDLKKVLEERNNKIIKVEEKVIKNKEFHLPSYTKPFIKGSTNKWQEAAYKFLVEKYDLSWNDILEADLHYCYFGEKYKNCIIIPCYFQNKLVSFIGRVWTKNAKKRYINCSNNAGLVNIKSILYNYNNMRIGQNLIVVTEGCFDAIKVGLHRAVATLGSEISQEQINLLVKLKPEKLIVLADNDPGNLNTLRKAKKLCDYLSIFMDTKYIEIPFKGKDPADLTREEINRLLC